MRQAIVNFARIVNMPTLSEPSYRNINAELHTAYQSAALMSMSNAAKTALNNSIDDNSLKNQSGETIGLCRVSLDGTWQKRGHASLNGDYHCQYNLANLVS